MLLGSLCDFYIYITDAHVVEEISHIMTNTARRARKVTLSGRSYLAGVIEEEQHEGRK